MREEAGGLQKGLPSSGQSAGRDSKSGGSSPLLGLRDTKAGRFLTDFNLVLQNLPQIVCLTQPCLSFGGTAGQPSAFPSSLPVFSPGHLPVMKSWQAQTHLGIQFSETRLLCLKTFNESLLTGRGAGPRSEREALSWVSGSSVAAPPELGCVRRMARVLFLTCRPFPPGRGSLLLVPAEGLHLLHAVRGRAHRGKCVPGTSPLLSRSPFSARGNSGLLQVHRGSCFGHPEPSPVVPVLRTGGGSAHLAP